MRNRRRLRSGCILMVLAAGLFPVLAVGQDGKPWELPGTQAGQEIIGPDGDAMVCVPAGEVMMGQDDGLGPERPGHKVRLTKGFWVGKHEVTNVQYRAFCQATSREFPSGSDQGDDHPVVFVSWGDAVAYARYYGLSLPTEAQWEYAARGPEARTYPWGDGWDPKKLCWGGNRGSGGQTAPVGSSLGGASWCGALDMAGNVSEWCADWFGEDYYRQSPPRNPTGPSTGTYRVLRDSDWGAGGAGYCRRAGRDGDIPGHDSPYHGFRCAKTVD